MVVFHKTFDFQGLVLVDVLPHFWNKSTTEPFSLNIKHAWISAYERKPACFCYLLVLKIISSGRRTTVVLQFRVAQNHPLKFLRMSDPFTTAIKSVIIAAFCSPPTHAHTYTCHKLIPPPSPFPLLVFFPSRAADERSRWFVLLMVSAPLSPLSDHLHLIVAMQLRSAA